MMQASHQVLYNLRDGPFLTPPHKLNDSAFAMLTIVLSFPFTEHETVPSWLLVTLSAAVPIVIILFIALVLVPGNTVPPGTPKSLIWKRKLWELHAGWQGLALALAIAWFITNGMKNLFGKPRPDLLARCNPDVENFTQYVKGGVNNVGTGWERLVSADICQSSGAELQDGFRSFPSGHASSAAAGLIYLSLFIASKLAITFPFLAAAGYRNESSFSAFPSRATRHLGAQRGPTADLEPEAYELSNRTNSAATADQHLSNHDDPATAARLARHEATLTAVRRQAAAPPIYLLVFAAAPFSTAIFIASSRWFDYRHHGFDIMFGFLIGTIAAFTAFRWYHLPITQGAGWAWGPRSADKAWWAGVGSFSYATDREKYHVRRAGDEEEAIKGKAASHEDGRGTGARV